MDVISMEGYEYAKVICLKTKNGDLWVIMKRVKDGLGVKNMSDLVLKEIYGAHGKNFTKEEIKYYKITEREFFKTFYDYDEDALSTILSRQILLKIVKLKKKRGRVSREF